MTPKSTRIAYGIGAALLAVVFFGWTGLSLIRWMHGIYFSAPWLWIPLIILAGLVGIVYAANYRTNPDRALVISGALAAVVLVYSVAFGWFFVPYLKSSNYADRAVEVETVTDFEARAPWIVAANYSKRDQGESVGELDPMMVTHVPEEGAETSRYAVPVVGRGFAGLTGYSNIQEYDLPRVGPISAQASNSCDVPSHMNDRAGAFWPQHSLNRSISMKNPFVHWDTSDMYSYCDSEGEPVIVLPLTTYEGFWITNRVPAGAAVYTPEGLEIMDGEELVEAGIEGPTFPASLAEIQRNGLKASGSMGDWFAKRAGYDTTAKDSEDSNAGNVSEFLLVGTDDNLYYATPLTVRGSSQSIVAMMVAPGQQTGTSSDREFSIETNVNLTATSSIENSIRSASVKGDNEWTTRWAAGMRVYEMIPAKDGHWVASIGLGQEVNYRADISPNGSVSITRTTPIADSSDDTPNVEGDVTVDLATPLDEMTDAELVQLVEDAVNELAERNASNTATE